MSQTRPPSKLLPRVLWRVLPATVLVLLGVWFVAAEVVQRSVSMELHRRIDRHADQAATAISLKLQALVGVAESLAANDLVVNSLFDFQERENYIQTFFRSVGVPGLKGARVTLVDYRGRTVASNTRQVDYQGAPFVPSVMAGERYVRISREGVLIGHAALHAGQPEGIIVVELGREDLAALFAIPLQRGDFAIESAKGEILFSTGTAFSGTDQDTVTPGAEEWFFAKASVPWFPQIFLHVAERTTDAFALVDRLFHYLLIVLAISVGAVTLAVVTTAYLGTRPLNRFVEGIESIREARNLNFRMTPFGAAEFHALTSSFNLMLETLESTTTSRDYVDNVLNSIHEILLVTNEKGIVTTCNRAAVERLGYAAEELESTHVLAIISSEMEEVYGAGMTELSSVEGIITTSVGKIIPVLISASSLGAASAGGHRLIYVLTDITERKRIEQTIERHSAELARSNEELEQFASVASHDLQEPLRKVQAFGDRLQSKYAEALGDQGLDYLSRMRDATARMQTLIQDLLSFSRIATKGKPFVPVDLSRLAEEVVSDLEVLIQKTGAEVQIDGLPTVDVDPTQMRQLLQNLIGNALKYHREDVAPRIRLDGVIDVQASAVPNLPDKEVCYLCVTDNGIGFDQVYAERIFGIFQRLHGRDVYEGTGVGLAICRRIVERHGGGISAEGRPGEGATMTVTLPLCQSIEEYQ